MLAGRERNKEIGFRFLWNDVVSSIQAPKGTSINDVPRFLAIFDLPTYLPCPTLTHHIGGYLGPPYLPTLISDVINGRSLTYYDRVFCKTKVFKEVHSNRWMIEIYGFLLLRGNAEIFRLFHYDTLRICNIDYIIFPRKLFFF